MENISSNGGNFQCRYCQCVKPSECFASIYRRFSGTSTAICYECQARPSLDSCASSSATSSNTGKTTESFTSTDQFTIVRGKDGSVFLCSMSGELV